MLAVAEHRLIFISKALQTAISRQGDWFTQMHFNCNYHSPSDERTNEQTPGFVKGVTNTAERNIPKITAFRST